MGYCHLTTALQTELDLNHSLVAFLLTLDHAAVLVDEKETLAVEH